MTRCSVLTLVCAVLVLAKSQLSGEDVSCYLNPYLSNAAEVDRFDVVVPEHCLSGTITWEYPVGSFYMSMQRSNGLYILCLVESAWTSLAGLKELTGGVNKDVPIPVKEANRSQKQQTFASGVITLTFDPFIRDGRYGKTFSRWHRTEGRGMYLFNPDSSLGGTPTCTKSVDGKAEFLIITSTSPLYVSDVWYTVNVTTK